LSQSDSCIGAKCGINVYPYKNQIGVLHSPSRVLIVSEFLNTLEKEDFISGYGEILKLSLTPPGNFFGEFKESITQHGFDVNRVLPLLQRSLNAKKIIIEIDEYENDLRRILNYGHSFGHALEAVTDNEVNHGYGVLFGIELINFLSTKWGYLDQATKSTISDFIRLTFPIDFLPRKISAVELIKALHTDKKVVSGKINFAVLTNEMKLVILPKYIDQELESLVKEFLENECIFITS
jgi:3-dehydroquinate synthase